MYYVFYSHTHFCEYFSLIGHQIWSSVEAQEYLSATRLYLLARHVNTSLHLDQRRSADMLTWFPVLTRQWAAISHFKATILQASAGFLYRYSATSLVPCFLFSSLFKRPSSNHCFEERPS